MTIKNQPGQESEHSELLDELDQISKLTHSPTGMGRIARGECPLGAWTPISCMLCRCGHLLECHYPQTCAEARGGHYFEEMAIEGEGDGSEV